MHASDVPLTQRDLAEEVGKSRSWICEMLGLTKLLPEIQTLVSRGQINLGNAQQLAKLRPHLQTAHVEDAKTQNLTAFRQTVSAAINRFKEAVKTGKIEDYYSDQVRPYVRPLPEIHEERRTWVNGGRLIAKHACISPLDGWKLAIEWVFKMDPETLEFRRTKAQREELERLNESQERSKERQARKNENHA